MKPIFYRHILLLMTSMLVFQSHGSGQSRPGHAHKWTFYASAGLNAFRTSGIPASRNQLNYEAQVGEQAYTYQQESRNAGLCYEFGTYRVLSSKFQVGMMLQFYRDDDEYLSTNDLSMNVGAINGAGDETLTIRNLQSYVNLGFQGRYQLFGSSKGHQQFFASLGAGWAMNRTPDRTEYDYAEDDHFLNGGVDSTGFITYTRFRDGIYITPGVTYAIRTWPGQFVTCTLSSLIQSHSAQAMIQRPGITSGGGNEPVGYTLHAIQFKIGYSF